MTAEANEMSDDERGMANGKFSPSVRRFSDRLSASGEEGDPEEGVEVVLDQGLE